MCQEEAAKPVGCVPEIGLEVRGDVVRVVAFGLCAMCETRHAYRNRGSKLVILLLVQ